MMDSSARRSNVIEAPMRDIYTVSRLNLEARRLVESGFPPLWVEGEVSNLARPRSGHLYFSLKDDRCQVRCAMFRMHNRHLEFEPVNGMQVLAQVRVSLYPERGEFQLVAHYLEEAGAGALRRAFEALKQRLGNEGLFDDEAKQPLPRVPACIGIVTSPTGAALRDILTVMRRRFPGVHAILYPVPVQGSGAAARIAEMLERIAARAECDVLVLARGGGSIEDLWCFNEEAVARAIHRCPIPLVTGIGHETDFTIADFVADRRAPTPSAAAELITPDALQWRDDLERARLRLGRMMRRSIEERRARLSLLRRALPDPRRRVQDLSQRLDGLLTRSQRALWRTAERRRDTLRALLSRLHGQAPATVVRAYRIRAGVLRSRLDRCMEYGLERRRAQIRSLQRALTAVGPQQTLDRGYAIVSRRGGPVLRDATQVEPGEPIEARLARGRLEGTVTGRRTS